jgi:hypothetical protein
MIMARHVIMDPSGHSTFEFDPHNTVALTEAERRFKRLVAKGYIPAEQRGEGQHHVWGKGQRSFNPNVEETIFIPALKGG